MITINHPLICWRGNCWPKTWSCPSLICWPKSCPIRQHWKWPVDMPVPSRILCSSRVARLPGKTWPQAGECGQPDNQPLSAKTCTWKGQNFVFVRWGVRTLAYRDRMAPEATALDRSAKRTPAYPLVKTVIHIHMMRYLTALCCEAAVNGRPSGSTYYASSRPAQPQQFCSQFGKPWHIMSLTEHDYLNHHDQSRCLGITWQNSKGTSNHCMIAKACLKALHFAKSGGAV